MFLASDFVLRAPLALVSHLLTLGMALSELSNVSFQSLSGTLVLEALASAHETNYQKLCTLEAG